MQLISKLMTCTRTVAMQRRQAVSLVYCLMIAMTVRAQAYDPCIVEPVGGDPCEGFASLVVGIWDVANYDNQGQLNSPYSLTLQAGGVGSYPGYDVTWSLVTSNGLCYLRVYGFWHHAFETYRVFPAAETDAHLTPTMTGFRTYVQFPPDPYYPAQVYTKR